MKNQAFYVFLHFLGLISFDFLIYFFLEIFVRKEEGTDKDKDIT